MRRREFISVFGGAAVAWPLAVHAQQGERVRRVGVLFNTPPDDPETRKRLAIFTRECAALGWIEGNNLHLDVRGVETASLEQFKSAAMELVKLAPDLLVAGNVSEARTMLHETTTIPIVFVNVNEPVGEGLVLSLARPGGNITGFAKSEYSVVTKVLETFKELVPGMTRVLIFYPSTQTTVEIGQKSFVEAAARSLGVTSSVAAVRGVDDLEAQLAAFASSGGGVVMPGFTADYLRLVALAARYQLPAMYQSRIYVAAGGLISYAPDIRYQWGRASSYVDRILRGTKPGDLPIQQPTKYELLINLKTARTLGLTVPQTLLATADEVIE